MVNKERLILLLIPILLTSAKADFEPAVDLEPGDVFHWVFVTSTMRDATSSNIEDYNKHVNDAADAVSGPGKAVVGVSGKTLLGDIAWKAIASTETVNARDNIGNPSNGIYRLDGVLIASNEGDLFDGIILAAIDLTEILSSSAYAAWTGSYASGTRAYPLGKDPSQVMFGITSYADNHWMYAGTDAAKWSKPLYAISEPLTVISTSINIPPVTNVGGPYLVAVGQTIVLDGSVSYDEDGDLLSYLWTQVDNLGSFDVASAESPNYTGSQAGITDLTLTVSDGQADDSDTTMLVVYDPSGGFVTGGGWIWSPKGAYVADPWLEGKANFGFVSKYKKGASEPMGQTEFVFQAGDLNFHSSSYDWLVVAGAKAMFKGVGTINGAGDYGFMLSAIDAALTPSTSEDRFRIKIWDKNDNDAVVYDNQIGDDDNADVTTAIGGGSIVIHTK